MPFRFRELQKSIHLFPTSQKSLAHSKSKNKREDRMRKIHTLPASLPSVAARCVTDYLPVVVPACLTLPAVYTYKDCHHSLTTSFQDNKTVQPALKIAVKNVSLTVDDICVRPDRCFSDSDLHSVCERIPVNFITEPSPLSDCTVNRFSVLRNTEGNRTTQFSCSSSSPFDNSNILFFSSTDEKRSDKSSNQGKGPTPEQLGDALEPCQELVKNLLHGQTSYAILHPNIVLENNLHGTNRVSNGISAYGIEILKLRFKVYSRNIGAKMKLMNVTTLDKRGVIRVHWRMTGVSQFDLFKFWKLFTKDNEECIEAFSYFHIGSDGLVHKIKIDRSLPEDGGEEPVQLKEKLKNMLNPKPSPVMCT